MSNIYNSWAIASGSTLFVCFLLFLLILYMPLKIVYIVPYLQPNTLKRDVDESVLFSHEDTYPTSVRQIL